MLAQPVMSRKNYRMSVKSPPPAPVRTCIICSKEVYSKSLCRQHYMKSRNMGVDPSKLMAIAGAEPPAKKEKRVPISPRVLAETKARFQRAVKRGHSSSVYMLAATILDAWRDPDEPEEKQPKEEK